jgi:hypothetical protein
MFVSFRNAVSFRTGSAIAPFGHDEDGHDSKKDNSKKKKRDIEINSEFVKHLDWTERQKVVALVKQIQEGEAEAEAAEEAHTKEADLAAPGGSNSFRKTSSSKGDEDMKKIHSIKARYTVLRDPSTYFSSTKQTSAGTGDATIASSSVKQSTRNNNCGTQVNLTFKNGVYLLSFHGNIDAETEGDDAEDDFEDELLRKNTAYNSQSKGAGHRHTIAGHGNHSQIGSPAESKEEFVGAIHAHTKKKPSTIINTNSSASSKNSASHNSSKQSSDFRNLLDSFNRRVGQAKTLIDSSR